jgi:SAM-dependent methyltransferase
VTTKLTWEQAVLWLREQPDQQALVRACYYDDPLVEATQRFADSAEWQATRMLLPSAKGQALDLGAGRGISSFALASEGWQVVALEPDPGETVGVGAIRRLAETTGLPIRVVENYAEHLPFGSAVFDLVYGRQVLHHARDLDLLCREAARVLKKGGWFVATREHVISRRADLPVFLSNHPLHKLYGGENAYLLGEYRSAIRASGLRLKQVLGPFESVINYAPLSSRELQSLLQRPLTRLFGTRGIERLLSQNHVLGGYLTRWLFRIASRMSDTPGRFYSFVLEKPA